MSLTIGRHYLRGMISEQRRETTDFAKAEPGSWLQKPLCHLRRFPCPTFMRDAPSSLSSLSTALVELNQVIYSTITLGGSHQLNVVRLGIVLQICTEQWATLVFKLDPYLIVGRLLPR